MGLTLCAFGLFVLGLGLSFGLAFWLVEGLGFRASGLLVSTGGVEHPL